MINKIDEIEANHYKMKKNKEKFKIIDKIIELKNPLRKKGLELMDIGFICPRLQTNYHWMICSENKNCTDLAKNICKSLIK